MQGRERRTETDVDRYLKDEAKDKFDRVLATIFQGLLNSGISEPDAREKATYIA